MHTFLAELKLNNFRNYKSKTFKFNSKITAISGANGVGKTNILESISLLCKGHGLKSAEFEEMISKQSLQPNFTIYSKIKNHPHIEQIGTSYLANENKRIFQINHKIISSSSRYKYFPAIIWLVPAMDNLFCSSKTLRRKFLDKIVSDIDPSHSTRINSYNNLLKERLSLLGRFSSYEKWLDVIEREIAELASAIASARNLVVDDLNKAILQGSENFTKAKIKIIGDAEEISANNKAIEVEDKFMQNLYANRELDLKTGRTMFGVHRSDITAILLNKEMEAKFCSTGEQKSILIALTIARVRMFSFLNLPAPILLLDEIVSHLDEQKRINLLNEISLLDCQSFLTATSNEFFKIPLSHFDNETVTFLDI